MRKECKHGKTFEIRGHCNDLFSWNYNDEGWSESNYAPEINGLCSGDDIQIKFCLCCHKILDLISEDIETFVDEEKGLDIDLTDESVDWDNEDV